MTKYMKNKKLLCAILAGMMISSPVLNAWAEEAAAPAVKNATTTVGLKKKTTARILDNFNKNEKELLFDTFPISLDDELGIALQEKKKRTMEAVLARLDRIQSQYKEQKKEVTKKKLTLKALVKSLDDSIEEAAANIATLQNEIAQKNRQMSDLSSKIDDLQTKIDSNKKALLEYLSYIYSQSDRLYDDSNNEIDIMKSILLNDGSLSDVMSDIHYKTIVELAGQNFIEMYRSFVKEFYYSKEKLKDEKKNQLVLRTKLITQNNELETQKSYKEELLQITR